MCQLNRIHGSITVIYGSWSLVRLIRDKRSTPTTKFMDTTVPRIFADDVERPPSHIQVTVPYWIYRRVSTALTFMHSSAKPEDYIVAIPEGAVKELNL